MVKRTPMPTITPTPIIVPLLAKGADDEGGAVDGR